MREYGVKDFPDPKVSPNGGTELSFNGEGVDPKTMEAAEQACARFQDDGGAGGTQLSPQQKVEQEEQVQEFAKCMREHGIEVQAEVSSGGGGVAVGVGPGPGEGGNHAEGPALEAAQEDCQGLLPGSSGSGPGGG